MLAPLARFDAAAANACALYLHFPALAHRRTSRQLEGMTRSALLNEILDLPADERLHLVEKIWDSLAVSAESVPVPDWHKAELDLSLIHI